MGPRATSAALLALMAAAPAARAAAPKAPGSPSAAACACERSERCWKLVETVYPKIVEAELKEVDGAMPDRFFRGATTFALRRPDRRGHFLKVSCPRTSCVGKRDELQQRLIYTSLLSSLPLNAPKGTLYDPMTWRLTDAGRETISAARRCRTGLIAWLAGATLAAVGR
ncbi:MAG: hypothetical protein KGM24_15420 [Elusimicrobia bacterium]|nr:hypothetical protein [Elusimicrobiota bacterium]